MDSDGFTLVKYSKKNPKKKINKLYSCEITVDCTNQNTSSSEPGDVIEVENYCEYIIALEKEFSKSQFFLNFCKNVLKVHKLVDSTTTLPSYRERFTPCNEITKIVCLGLGNFTSSKQSQYQLVFLRYVISMLICIEKIIWKFYVNTSSAI